MMDSQIPDLPTTPAVDSSFIKSEEMEIEEKPEMKIPNSNSPATASKPSNETTDNSAPFSCENFKICIHNIPRYADAKSLKKLMKRLDFDVRKAYVVRDHAFVCFVDDQSVDRALIALNNYKWKKNVLRVKRAAANIDPVLAKKAKRENSGKPKSDGPGSSMEKVENVEEGEEEMEEKPETDDDRSPEERVLDAVTPLHRMEYSAQLELKNQESLKLLKEISRNMTSVADCDRLPSCGYFGELKSILASPIIDGYRNKCEFSIGFDHGQKPTIGFRLTRYKAGNVEIVSPQNCPHVPDMTKKIVAILQEYVIVSALAPYDVTSKHGFWTMLTVRQFHMDTMVIVTAYNRGHYSSDQISMAKNGLIDLFSRTDHQGYRVTSLYFQLLEQTSDKAAYDHLWGTPYVYENLLDLRFRISPGAFFQVNTAACEILYKSIDRACQIDQDTLLLDLCCGTGTIGIVLASKAAKVIGIELCPEAVQDAKINMKNNERQNCEFICGRVENSIDEMRRRTTSRYKRIVGILDPPRSGLPGKVLSSIRLFQAMQTVVYVSCDPKAASKNFLDLQRRTSNRYPGDPFRLKMIQPIDMFPHTKHCEWILVFER